MTARKIALVLRVLPSVRIFQTFFFFFNFVAKFKTISAGDLNLAASHFASINRIYVLRV